MPYYPYPAAPDCSAAVAAERERAYDWHAIGRDTVTLTWSDPEGLVSDYDLDPVAGVVEVTTNPLVQTATPADFAGFEGQIFGKVADMSFAAHVNAILMRLKFDLSLATPSAGSDLDLLVMVMNGPRATADYWFGGGWTWAPAGSTWRSRAVMNRGGSQSTGTAPADSNALISACATQSNIANYWQVGSRGLQGNGAFPGGSSTLGSQINGSTPISQAVWGTETWMFMGVGARAGTDPSSHTLRFYADVTRTAVDMTSASFPF